MKTIRPSASSQDVQTASSGLKKNTNVAKSWGNPPARVDTEESITPVRSMFSPHRLQLKPPAPAAASTVISTLAVEVQAAYAANFYAYVDRLAVSLPAPMKHHQAPNPEGAVVDRKHMALYLGESNCIGSGHVARWVADAIESGIRASRFLHNTPIKRGHKAAVKENLARSAEKLRELQLIRSCLDSARWILHYTSHYEKTSVDHIGESFSSHVAAYVLSRLFSGQQVLIPVDFWGYEYAEHMAEDSELIGHATSMLLIPTTKDPARVILRLFETNGAFSPIVKRSAVLKAREDSENIERKEKMLGPVDFSLDDLVSRHAAATIDSKQKIFPHIDVEVEMKSLRPTATYYSESVQDAADDVQFLSRFLALNYAHRRGSLQEAANTLEAQLYDRGTPSIPRQRMHAVQETGSCELKSLTVAAASLLNDEVAYQAINMLLAESVSAMYTKNGSSDPELLKQIEHEMERAGKRLEHAAFAHKSS